MSIGKRIKERRIELGMTQKELAKKVGCDDDSILRWEKEVSKSLPIYVEKLEKVLGISLKEVSDESSNNAPPDN